MSKLRVYELARELKKDSKTLIKELQNMGIKIASHQNVLSADQISKIRKANSIPTQDSESQPQKKVVVRRRKKVIAKKEELVQEVPPQAGEVKSEAPIDKKTENEIVSSDDTISKSKIELETRPQDGESTSFIKSGTKSAQNNIDKPIAEIKKDEKTQEDNHESLEKKLDSSNLITNKVDVTKRDKEIQEKPPLQTAKKVELSPKLSNTSKNEASVRKKSSEGSATIVRRATVDEKNQLIQQNLMNKTKREDPRSIKLTSPVALRRDESPSTKNVDHNKVEQQFTTSRTYESYSKKDLEKTDDDNQHQKRVSARKKSKDFSASLGAPEDLAEFSRFIPQTLKKRVYSNHFQNRRKKDLRRREAKSTQITTPRASYRIVKMENDSIIVFDLAKQLSVKVSDVIKKLMNNGIMVTQNQSIDFDTATLIAEEYGYKCKITAKSEEELLNVSVSENAESSSRPPIVTVMGHVDHGKTSILDVIRKTGVADKEAGGITQHIGAYTVKHNDSSITFIDTPGHAAFSAMRSRGAKLTDIVILVVAADDGVMPQTVEAISHAKEANVPMIVAINKIDKANINLDRIYHELSEHGIQSEEWGGEYQFIKVSALENRGIEDLLEAIILQAEMQELKGQVSGPASGVVIEAHLEKGRGPVATVVVTSGKLSVGEHVVVGTAFGKVRAMADHTGKKVKEISISNPVEIVGLNSVPLAGDILNVVSEEKIAREIAELRHRKLEEKMSSMSSAQSLDDLLGKMKSDSLPKLSILLKTDTQGTAEAIHESLSKLNSAKVVLQVVHKAVGGINESDLNLAETSGAVVLGFNVRMPSSLQDQCDKRGIIVKYFNVIYELIDSTKALMQGKLPPILNEVIQGHATVRDTINIPKIGLIAGSSVTDGKITRSSLLRLIRDDVVIYDGKMGSLKRFKDDVKEVQNGYECGIGIEGFHDIKKDDVIEAYMMEEEEAKLDI